MHEPAPAWALTLISEIRALRAELREHRAARPAAVVDPVDHLRLAAERAGIHVSLDDHVDEAGAATLLGISRSGLKARRLECRLPIGHRRNGRRVEYSLDAVAEFLAGCAENDF